MWQVVGVQRVSVRGLLLCDFSTQAFYKNQMISKVLRHSKLIWGEKSNWEWSVCLVVLLYLALIILLLGFKNRQKKKQHVNASQPGECRSALGVLGI